MGYDNEEKLLKLESFTDADFRKLSTQGRRHDRTGGWGDGDRRLRRNWDAR
jgi:hypothetical protein